MIFSLKWLNDFVEVLDFLDGPEKLSKILTNAGLEVEDLSQPSRQFQNIIVGEIKRLKKHPNADRLSLCEVLGEGGKMRRIVCGASNPKEGDKVVLALPGAVLPGDFAINASVIRGEKSEGMLVSAKELGLIVDETLSDQKTEGIIILSPKAKVGEPYSKEAGLDDVFLDINVTPNRSDSLSHLGLARELSCLLNRPLKNPPAFVRKKTGVFMKPKLKLQVKAPKACPRYCGRMITGVSIGLSPDWLRARLKAVGLKSINNVVDVTNYILIDLGQPLHAFDRDKIQSVCVDNAIKGEKFAALDGQVLTLTGSELSIRDGKRAIALAGVIGDKSTSIQAGTKNIFVEAAAFASQSVRRTARYFGLNTESSYRFSRGIDKSAVLEALNRACRLIQETAGGQISEDYFDEYAQTSPCPLILIQLEDVEERLSYKLESSKFADWMKRLNCEVKKEGDTFLIQPPSFRGDLKLKEDLIEEIARLEGYHKVPVLPLKRLTGVPKDFDSSYLLKEKVNRIMESGGWYQLLNYSFSEKSFYESFLKDQSESLYNLGLVPKKAQPVSLKNPLSVQLALMKPLLVPDVLKTLVFNFRHNNKSGEVFETAPVFFQVNGKYIQTEHLVLARWGHPVDLWGDNRYPNLFYLKSALQRLFSRMNVRSYSWEKISSPLSFLHPGQMLGLKVQGQMAGFIGALHPALQSQYKLNLDVALGEISLNALTDINKSMKAKPLPECLSVTRDLTFVLPQTVSAGDVAGEIKKACRGQAEAVDIIAVFKEPKKQDRAISFRLNLPAQKTAWTDELLGVLQDRIIEQVQAKFQITLK